MFKLNFRQYLLLRFAVSFLRWLNETIVFAMDTPEMFFTLLVPEVAIDVTELERSLD